MKYQIIVETEEYFADDTFEQIVKPRLEACLPEFTYLYAQNLDGVRKELYLRKEELKEELAEFEDVDETLVDESFDEIQKLFKLT